MGGAGIMATGMCKMLLKNEFSVAVWNRSKPRLAEVETAGASIFTDMEEFLKFVKNQNQQKNHPNVFLMCVSDPAAIKSVYETYKLKNLFDKENDHLIDMSTINVETVKYQSKIIKNFLEAPVSGSKPQANSGQLVILCSGNKNTYNLVSQNSFENFPNLFDILGKKTFYFGEEFGAGAKMKLCVNQFMGNVMTSLSESITLAEKCGGNSFSSSDLVEVLLNGALSSPIVKAKGPNMIKNNFEPNFPIEHQAKDLKLAVELGKEHGLENLAVTEKSLEIFKKVEGQQQEGQIDMCGVVKAY